MACIPGFFLSLLMATSSVFKLLKIYYRSLLVPPLNVKRSSKTALITLIIWFN